MLTNPVQSIRFVDGNKDYEPAKAAYERHFYHRDLSV